jgi:holo-[acyl-carrier protein] synthase
VIYGIGADLCDIRRIRATLARRGERFAEKVLGPHELAEWFAARSLRAHVTVSDEQDYAVAFVVVETAVP